MTKPAEEPLDVTRFLADFREWQSIDAEPEFADLCGSCLLYPAVHHSMCFTCASKGRLPS